VQYQFLIIKVNEQNLLFRPKIHTNYFTILPVTRPLNKTTKFSNLLSITFSSTSLRSFSFGPARQTVFKALTIRYLFEGRVKF
jgi:hypothetical protein